MHYCNIGPSKGTAQCMWCYIFVLFLLSLSVRIGEKRVLLSETWEQIITAKFSFSLYHVPFPWKGSEQDAVIRLRVGETMPKNLSCDWLTQFMKFILLGLSLVRTSLQYRCTETGLQYKHTAVQLIQA